MSNPSVRLPAFSGGGSSRYSDLLLVACVVAILSMMVLPLPSLLIDALVGINIATGVVLLLVALYIRGALDFSVYPSVLLISTLFRLALSIATTRQILLHAHAGAIINTFGHMVAGGNLVVGLVVFLIITVVQFIVVAKGAERVAEVSARFTLDAMPGKQLSIDNDLRSGLIDKDEARRRRRDLEQESKLHGSLDGAMKFVKGDAIAGIVIIVINLLGGLAIGVMQQGMDVSTAMQKYSILTIGEGMVAQLPALLSAMSAGLIVTRTADERDRHLGDAISRQLAGQPRVLLVASGLCLMLTLVPGFPWVVFLLLSLAFGASGALLLPTVRERWQRFSRPAREAVLRRKEAPPEALATAMPVPVAARPLVLRVPTQAIKTSDAAARLVRALDGVLDGFNLGLGISLPSIQIEGVADTQVWQLKAFETPIAEGIVAADDEPPALANAVRNALRRHVTLFLGTQEAGALLNRTNLEWPEVVKEVHRVLPLPRIADALRRLVEEEVSIRNARDTLEALAEAAQREKEMHLITELVRMSLKRQISHHVAPDGDMRALWLTPALEDMLRQSLRMVAGTQHLALDPRQANALRETLVQAIRAHQPNVIVTAIEIRRHVRKLIEADCFDTPVMSFHELMPTARMTVLARIDMPVVAIPEAA